MLFCQFHLLAWSPYAIYTQSCRWPCHTIKPHARLCNAFLNAIDSSEPREMILSDELVRVRSDTGLPRRSLGLPPTQSFTSCQS